MALANRNGVMVVILVALLAMMLAYLLPLMPDPQPMSGHVTEKRGTSNMERTSKCNADPNATLFYNPLTGRYGKVCRLDGTWFVVIVDGANRVITGFPKEKMHDFSQVMKYMQNAGYQLVH